ncbi:MAG: transposase [Gammaproteobacteria bacterium]
MARPLRIEFNGALYHVTSRGDRREDIYEDDEDREAFLAVLAEVVRRFNWICHAYCLMDNHYHLMVETPDGNLSKGMRQLNGVYTQATNRRHGRTGHLFQGRFKGILVDKNNYLLELGRYVVLNPVRARIVKKPEDYAWSSYRATVGAAAVPPWLATDGVLAQFGKRRADARRRYRRFVMDGIGGMDLWANVSQQIYLGDKRFVKRMQAKAAKLNDKSSIPHAQRRAPAPSLARLEKRHRNRDDAMVAAHATGAYSYREIGEYFGLHQASVGRIVRARMPGCET